MLNIEYVLKVSISCCICKRFCFRYQMDEDHQIGAAKADEDMKDNDNKADFDVEDYDPFDMDDEPYSQQSEQHKEHVKKVKEMERENGVNEVEEDMDYHDPLRDARMQDILIEIDASLQRFLETLEIGSILSLSEIVNQATKYNCEHCKDVFYSSSIYNVHLLSHVEKVENEIDEEENGKTGVEEATSYEEQEEVKAEKTEILNILKTEKSNDLYCGDEPMKKKKRVYATYVTINAKVKLI